LSIATLNNIKVVSSNPAHGQVYSIQHYVIKFDLRQVGDVLHELNWPPRYNWTWLVESEQFWNSWKFRPGVLEVFEVFRVVQDKNLTLPFYNYYPNLKDSFIIAFIEIQVETLLWILKIKNRQQTPNDGNSSIKGNEIKCFFWWFIKWI
jgi:hypothetical protein